MIITFSFLQVWSVSCFLEYVMFSSLYTVVNPRSRVLPSSLRGSSCRCIEMGIVFWTNEMFCSEKKTNYGQTKWIVQRNEKIINFFKNELKNPRFKTFLLNKRFYWTNDFTERSFSEKWTDGKWTIILKTNKINFFNDWKNDRIGSFTNDERTK